MYCGFDSYDDYYDARQEAAAERRRAYAEDWPDEEPSESEALTRYVTARKARYVGSPCEVREGDKVLVKSYFTYDEETHKRLAYHHSYSRVAKGSAWGEQAETEKWEKYEALAVKQRAARRAKEKARVERKANWRAEYKASLARVKAANAANVAKAA